MECAFSVYHTYERIDIPDDFYVVFPVVRFSGGAGTIQQHQRFIEHGPQNMVILFAMIVNFSFHFRE